MRDAGRWAVGALWAMNLVWAGALVVAPLSLDPGSVNDLHGRANFIDHRSTWETLSWFPRLVYTFADLQCHQMASRSWELGGNQMPVDARMFSGFLFGVVGLGWAWAAPARERLRDALTDAIPARWRGPAATGSRRMWLLVSAWVVGVGPALLDVTVQAATAYESTNALRLATGAVLGAIGGFLVGALLRSFWADGTRPSAAP